MGIGHRATAAVDLERRRLAIVRALRGETDGPDGSSTLPTSPARSTAPVPDDRLHRLERDVAAVRSHLAELAARVRHVVDERDSDPTYPAGPQPTYPAGPQPRPVTVPTDDVAVADDGGPAQPPPVPAVEALAPMSDTASRALFGY